MKHLPELVAAYAAMSPYAQELLRDFAKELGNRLPARTPAMKPRKSPPGRTPSSSV